MLDRLFSALIDGIYEGFKWHTAFIICLLGTFGNELPKRSLLFACLIFSVAIYFVNEMHNFKKWIRTTLAVTCGLVCGFVFYHDVASRIVGAIFYSFVLWYIWCRRQGKTYFDDEIKQSGIVVAIGVVLTCFVRVGSVYANSVNQNVLFFVFFTVLYLIRLHLINEYDSAALSISRRRNLVILDVALLIFAVVFIVAGKNALVYLPKLLLYIVYAIVIVMTYIWRVAQWLMYLFQNVYLWLTNYRQGAHYEAPEGPRETGFVWVEPENWAQVEELLETFGHSSPVSDIIMSIIFIALAVMSVGGLVYFAIVFWPKNNHEETYIFAKTEKEFIFNPREFMAERRNRRQKYLTTSSSVKIRKEYAKKVTELHDKHKVVMEPYMTPNEFARIVHAEHHDDDYSFSDLTRKYNEVRYKENE